MWAPITKVMIHKETLARCCASLDLAWSCNSKASHSSSIWRYSNYQCKVLQPWGQLIYLYRSCCHFLPLLILLYFWTLGDVMTKLTTSEAFDLQHVLFLLLASFWVLSLAGTFLQLSLTGKGYIIFFLLNLRPFATTTSNTLNRTEP